MKKQHYEKPQCETVRLAFENTVLSGSFGDPGKPGGDLNPLDPIDFGAPMFDGLI